MEIQEENIKIEIQEKIKNKRGRPRKEKPPKQPKEPKPKKEKPPKIPKQRGRPRKEKPPKEPKPRKILSPEEKKEKTKERNKKMYETIKDKRYQCECGKMVDIYNKFLHNKSKYHNIGLEKQKDLKNILSNIEEQLTNKEDLEKIKSLFVR